MLDKIIAEMPKAENIHSHELWRGTGFSERVEAQCKLLAKQGYRKVRSSDERLKKARALIDRYIGKPGWFPWGILRW